MSILKRGVYGVFHHVGDGYLPMYLGEFALELEIGYATLKRLLDARGVSGT